MEKKQLPTKNKSPANILKTATTKVHQVAKSKAKRPSHPNIEASNKDEDGEVNEDLQRNKNELKMKTKAKGPEGEAEAATKKEDNGKS